MHIKLVNIFFIQDFVLLPSSIALTLNFKTALLSGPLLDIPILLKFLLSLNISTTVKG